MRENSEWSQLDQQGRSIVASQRTLEARNIDAIVQRTGELALKLGWTPDEVKVLQSAASNAIGIIREPLGAMVNASRVEEAVAGALKILHEKNIDPSAFEPVESLRQMAKHKDEMVRHATVLSQWAPLKE